MSDKISIDPIFKASPFAGLIVMPDSPRFTIVGATDNFLKTYQKKESDLLKKGFFETFGDSDSEEQSNALRDLKVLFSTAIKNGLHGKLKRFYVKANKDDRNPFKGKYVTVEITPVPDDSNLPVSIIVSFNRDTKRASYNPGSQNGHFFSSIVENSLVAFFLAKPDGSILGANKAACDLFGYSLTEFKKIGRQGLIDHSDPDTIKKIKDRTESGMVTGELTGIKKDGEKFFMEVASFIFSDLNGEERASTSIIDISERKKVEIALLKSERYLHEAQKLAKMGSWNFDLKTDKLTWTKGLYEVFGADQDTFLETHGSFIHLVIEADRAFVLETSRRSQLTGEPFNIQYCITTPSGENRFIEEFGYSEKNTDGTIVRLFGTAQDITERKQVEQILKLSEKKYKTLFENNPMPMFIWDFETLNIIDCNEEALLKYGYTRDEFLTLSIRDIRPKEDIALIETATANENLYGQIHREIWRHLKKNGELMQMEITGHLMDYNGKRASLILLNDVTEKKNLEVLLQKSNRLAAIGSWEIDVINGTVYWSDITKEIREVDPDFIPDLSTGIRYFKEGESRQTISQSVKNCIAHGTPWDEELQILTHKGNLKWIRTIGEAEMVNGKCIRVYGSFQDITERKEYEDSLKLLNETLEQNAKELAFSNKELEQFSYVASHDLQEPLRMVTSFLTQLEKKYGDTIDDKGKQYIYFAMDGAKRMRQIILDLLDFSKAGTQNKDMEQVNINDLVNDVLLLYKNKIVESGATVELENLPVINSHKTPLIQVFHNLNSNALKYRNLKKAPVITVSCRPIPGYWMFSIRDNGIGISKQYFEKIFIIFQRLHSKGEYKGTGIGLAIVKKNINKLDGKIWVESEEDKGTVFYFTLPDHKEN
ncbi:MAG: PAS domain S-box protein [Ferruginibacter sp.]